MSLSGDLSILMSRRNTFTFLALGKNGSHFSFSDIKPGNTFESRSLMPECLRYRWTADASGELTHTHTTVNTTYYNILYVDTWITASHISELHTFCPPHVLICKERRHFSITTHTHTHTHTHTWTVKQSSVHKSQVRFARVPGHGHEGRLTLCVQLSCDLLCVCLGHVTSLCVCVWVMWAGLRRGVSR